VTVFPTTAASHRIADPSWEMTPAPAQKIENPHQMYLARSWDQLETAIWIWVADQWERKLLSQDRPWWIWI
jgi:hypothetical protein